MTHTPRGEEVDDVMRVGKTGNELVSYSGDRVFEFAFFGACIRLRGATGAPMRPVAMPLRR
jgi:hypothetical protein